MRSRLAPEILARSALPGLDLKRDAPAEYPLDLDAPMSIIVDQRAFAQQVPPGSGLERVKAVRVKLLPGATAVDLRLTIGDEAQAQRLVPPVRSLLGEAARQLGGGDARSVRLSTGIDGGDVIARLSLPAQALETFAARITLPRAR